MPYQYGGNQWGFGGGYSNIPIPGMAKLDAAIKTLTEWNRELEAISSGQRTNRKAASMPPNGRNTGVGLGAMNSGFSQQGNVTSGGNQQNSRFTEGNRVQSRTNIPIPGMAKLDAAIETLKKWNKELEDININKAKGNVNKTSQNVAVASAATNLAAKQTRPNGQGATNKFSTGGNVPHITAINTEQNGADAKKAIGNNLSGSNRDFNGTPSSRQEKNNQRISDSRGKPTTVDGSARNTDVNSISKNKTGESNAGNPGINSKNIEKQDRLSEANDIENQKKKAQDIEKKKQDFENELKDKLNNCNMLYSDETKVWDFEDFCNMYKEDISKIKKAIENSDDGYENMKKEFMERVEKELKSLKKGLINMLRKIREIEPICKKSYEELKRKGYSACKAAMRGESELRSIVNSINEIIDKVTNLNSRKERRQKKKNNQA